METRVSNNSTDSDVLQLANEIGNLTPSPPRKKCRQFNGSSELSHQVGSTLNYGRPPDESSSSIGFDFASSSLGAMDGTNICAPVINKGDKPSVDETNVVTVRRHHVEMTLFGAVCFHPGCMTRLGTSLFGVSDTTLRSHFDTKQCYTGRRPDCTNLVRDLRQDLSTLQQLVRKGGARVDKLVERVLPGSVTRSKGSYCINCGLVGRPGQLEENHLAGGSAYGCSIEHLRRNNWIVKSSVIRKVKIPEEVVTLIRQGKFLRGKWNDPREERIAPRMESMKDLSCQPFCEEGVSTSAPMLCRPLNVYETFLPGIPPDDHTVSSGCRCIQQPTESNWAHCPVLQFVPDIWGGGKCTGRTTQNILFS